MAVTRDDVLSYLESSNMVEISELIKDIEDKFGVTAAAPVAAIAAPADGGGAAGPTVMGIVANSFSLAIASYSSGFIALIGIFFLRFLVKETLVKKTKK